MGGSTKKLPFERNVRNEFLTPPDTPDASALRGYGDLDMPESLRPSVEAQFNRAEETTANAENSAYNQALPLSARNARMAQYRRGFAQDKAAAISDAALQAKQNNWYAGFQRRLASAGLSRPQLAVTGESGYNSQPSTPWWQSLLGGAASAAGAYFSDERLKHNIRPESGVLDKLDGYQAKEWDWNDGSGHADGVVAQDLEHSFPESVIGDDDGDEPMKVNYGDPSLAAQALQGVKELNQKVDQLMMRRRRMARRA